MTIHLFGMLLYHYFGLFGISIILINMSLPDTAEYWWDIKNRPCRIPNKTMVHIPQSECRHFNSITGNTRISKYLNDITCYECLSMLKASGNIYNLIEGTSPRQQSEIDKEKHRFRFGKCICGSPLCERINKSTQHKFLGCTNYPKCKNTKSI